LECEVEPESKGNSDVAAEFSRHVHIISSEVALRGKNVDHPVRANVDLIRQSGIRPQQVFVALAFLQHWSLPILRMAADAST
jgi:hypothetical protein